MGAQFQRELPPQNKTKCLPRIENQKPQVERDKVRERNENKVNEQARNESRERVEKAPKFARGEILNLKFDY